jgi:hypothetical protein
LFVESLTFRHWRHYIQGMHKRMAVRHTWVRSALLAALSGARTTLGPVFASRDSDRWQRARPWILGGAACELLIDKIPGIPNRTAAAPLVGRAMMGSAVALVSRPKRGASSAVFAVALGAMAAVAGAMLSFEVRRLLSRRLGGHKMANLVSGAIEDGLAIAAGRALA